MNDEPVQNLDTTEMKELLDQVTFIVTVRGRCKHVRRLLDYYADYPVRVLLLDSSDKKCKIERHPDHFEHLHTPQTHLMDAIITALDKVQTPYCLNAPDDDFFIPSAVAQCVRFLNDHPDHQCVQGYYARFLNKENITLKNCYPRMLGAAVVSETPDKRMIELAAYYVTWHHGVHRTLPSRRVIMSSRPATNLSANEFVTGSLFAIEGKSAVLPILFCIREAIFTAMSSLLGTKKYQPKFLNILEQPEAHRDILTICENILLKGLSDKGISNEHALKCIQDALKANLMFRKNSNELIKQHCNSLSRPKPLTFDEVMKTPEAIKSWAQIEVLIKKYNLDPLVKPLFVNADGSTLHNWHFYFGVYVPQKIMSVLRRWRKKHFNSLTGG